MRSGFTRGSIPGASFERCSLCLRCQVRGVGGFVLVGGVGGGGGGGVLRVVVCGVVRRGVCCVCGVVLVVCLCV